MPFSVTLCYFCGCRTLSFLGGLRVLRLLHCTLTAFGKPFPVVSSFNLFRMFSRTSRERKQARKKKKNQQLWADFRNFLENQIQPRNLNQNDEIWIFCRIHSFWQLSGILSCSSTSPWKIVWKYMISVNFRKTVGLQNSEMTETVHTIWTSAVIWTFTLIIVWHTILKKMRFFDAGIGVDLAS